MADLISREALLNGDDVCRVTEYDEAGFSMRYKAVPVEAIRQAPAVDAEPVVHCKDCKHMKMNSGMRFCNVWVAFNGAGDDGFCNYGERRDGDAAD